MDDDERGESRTKKRCSREIMSIVREEHTIDDIKTKHEELCRELNMDLESEEASWSKYSEVSKRFSLEGQPTLWICCSLYAACRISYTPTVGESNDVIMGNCVSLNKLLRCCNTSIYDFISKVKHWHEIANLAPGFLTQIERLERNIHTTINIFQIYNSVFENIFVCPRNEKKNTKYRSAAKCSSNKLYKICWCLYLCAKNENPNNTLDIVTSFHLLLCCVDLMYRNVLAENRIDLINAEFDGVPPNWNTPIFDVNCVTTHCILDPLCQISNAIPAEAKKMKRDSWSTIIKEFFRTHTIYGNAETHLGIVSNENFDRNVKSLNSSYEQYVLSVGEFDERILLDNPSKNITDSMERGRAEQHQMVKSLTPITPYTRKDSLPSKEAISEPVTNATKNVKKLQNLAHVSEPSEFLRQAGEDVLRKIHDKIQCMSEQFAQNYPDKTEATTRFKLAISLFYYMLDKIIRGEVRIKPNIDLKVLLDNDLFNEMLIACCVEIVLDAYNSSLKFPWTLTCFGIQAYQFCKIIELVVRRHEDILTRALIKHLNFVEETCLESGVWQKSSPLWKIRTSFGKDPLPTWRQVCNQPQCKSTLSDHQSLHTVKCEIAKPVAVQSPTNSACETFSSTVVNDSLRRDLFNTANDIAVAEKVKKVQVNKHPAFRIFLRKFYKVAWLRIRELCKELDMETDKFQNIIWTLFEYSITERTDLMQDRHLDQILMCAIYIYIKVGEVPNRSFSGIMKVYRKQPQATSSIYREVLLEEDENGKPEYGDLIKFYNSIYVKKMTPFALNFSEKTLSAHNLLISPHPTELQNFPKRPSSNHNVYISSLEKNEVTHSPNHITYEVGKSPAKDLKHMNDIVNAPGKRNLPFNDDATAKVPRVQDAPFYFNAIHEIINDRHKL